MVELKREEKRVCCELQLLAEAWQAAVERAVIASHQPAPIGLRKCQSKSVAAPPPVVSNEEFQTVYGRYSENIMTYRDGYTQANWSLWSAQDLFVFRKPTGTPKTSQP